MYRIDPFWAMHNYHGYSVVETRFGHYGIVFVFEAEDNHTKPFRFAVKTVDLTNQASVFSNEQLEVFEREIEIWMKIPFHNNVVPALGIDLVPVLNSDNWLRLPESLKIPGFNADCIPAANESCSQIGQVPFVRMPYCDSSLRSWIGDAYISVYTKCLAISHLCNGLSWLYEHGVQGHGDLKPENILVRDLLPDVLAIDENQPHFIIRVADLGWADAWIDLGYTQKSARQYLAPERLHKTVVPETSDMFAVGVIAAELFTGQHPAGKIVKKFTKSEGTWLRWAENGERQLSEIEFAPLREIVCACLDPNPKARPTAKSVIKQLSAFTQLTYDVDLESHCNAITKEVSQTELLHESWAPREIAVLGTRHRDNQIASLGTKLKSFGETCTVKDFAQWMCTWDALVELLKVRNLESDKGELERLAIQCARLLVVNSDVDLRQHFYPSWKNCSLDPREVRYEFSNKVIEIFDILASPETEYTKHLRIFNDDMVAFYAGMKKERQHLIEQCKNGEDQC